jgi:glycosyltransferase involved in cell wall biosynthesis
MQRVMSELAMHFASSDNIKLYLILYGKKPSIFYPVPHNINIYKPEFVFQDHFRLWYSIKTLVFLRKTIQKINPDTILSFGEYWNSFVLLSLFATRFPIYISDRCNPTKKYGAFHTFLRKWLYPKATGIIAQTALARDIYIQKKLNDNIQVIGNPIREILIDKTPLKKENTVLTVGRLIKTKHHDRLIRIFKRINNPDWKLVIAGDDALKQKNRILLEKLVHELNMENQVVFTGSVNDVENHYKKSKVFAFTSSSEGFPNVIGEAMSAGLPVVSYDCVAGPSDMIEDGKTGYLIPLFDDEKFQNRLEHLMDDEYQRMDMGLNARLAIKNFAVDVIAKKFFNFILSYR